ncbi:hypothetical protein JHC43_02675 [Marinobacter salarius]|jgi:hypothetical protein|uniref:hypothetical protein n=1 Tax=Marinobacter salarius TaxID=1420917 RepID=UPI0018F2058B|nr:hypothetical protein [Marinobacter salarius]MBJ7275360.1 hypothetical protein [Marinobacter salarius]|tara:strand:+ start:264 stop:1043 length:780 start_codon:yes stop_codon:yes gene_type:complete
MRFFTLLFLLISTHALANDTSEVRAFFNEYVERSNNFDVDIAELYSSNAKVRTLRDGSESIELNGSQWKATIRKVMPLAERLDDVSTYTDVRIDPHGEGYRVTALRSSALKCKDGLGYHMDVELEGGRWVIVEEFQETISLSQCEPSEELAATLSRVSDTLRQYLPMDLDADTRLESVEVEGTALIYNQRLHTVAASELNVDQVETSLKQIGVQNACGDARTSNLIDEGATIRYATVDRNGERLATVDISPGICSALVQ